MIIFKIWKTKRQGLRFFLNYPMKNMFLFENESIISYKIILKQKKLEFFKKKSRPDH